MALIGPFCPASESCRCFVRTTGSTGSDSELRYGTGSTPNSTQSTRSLNACPNSSGVNVR